MLLKDDRRPTFNSLTSIVAGLPGKPENFYGVYRVCRVISENFSKLPTISRIEREWHYNYRQIRRLHNRHFRKTLLNK